MPKYQRATSLLFDVLAGEDNVSEAQKALDAVTLRVLKSSASKKSAAGANGVQNGTTSSVDSRTNGTSQHSQLQDLPSSAEQQQAQSPPTAASSRLQVTTALPPATNGTPNGAPVTPALLAEHLKHATGPTPFAAYANGSTGAEHRPSIETAVVTEQKSGFVRGSLEAHDELDLEADRAALAKQLTHFTPEVILSELLGSLFVHPHRLRWEGLLGQGAYATVHKASLLSEFDASLSDPQPPLEHRGSGSGGSGGGGLVIPGEKVAVKRLKPEVLESTLDLKDFLLEANVLRKLQHNNIVAIRGIGASDLSSLSAARASIYVVMEALEGGTLRDMVTRQMTSRTLVYTALDALRWSQHVASAMHYLHDVCRPMIIHRDMKLENVLISSPDDAPLGRPAASQAKLADFGLHKRGRLNAATGMLVSAPPLGQRPHSGIIPVTPAASTGAGPGTAAAGVYTSWDDERSYYGGNFYQGGVNPSVRGGRLGMANANNPSVRGGARNSITGAGAGGSTHAGGLYGALGGLYGSVNSNPSSANNTTHSATQALAVLQAAAAAANSYTGPGGSLHGGQAMAGDAQRKTSLHHLVDVAASVQRAATNPAVGLATTSPSIVQLPGTANATASPHALGGINAWALPAPSREGSVHAGAQADDKPVHGNSAAHAALELVLAQQLNVFVEQPTLIAYDQVNTTLQAPTTFNQQQPTNPAPKQQPPPNTNQLQPPAAGPVSQLRKSSATQMRKSTSATSLAAIAEQQTTNKTVSNNRQSTDSTAHLRPTSSAINLASVDEHTPSPRDGNVQIGQARFGLSSGTALGSTPSLAHSDASDAAPHWSMGPSGPSRPAPLPAGMATLLVDPAQAANLQHLHALLATHDNLQDNSSHHPRNSLAALPRSSMPTDLCSGDNPHPLCARLAVPAPIDNTTAAAVKGGEGGSRHGAGGSRHGQQQASAHPHDVSVHQKMLALMALDASPADPPNVVQEQAEGAAGNRAGSGDAGPGGGPGPGRASGSNRTHSDAAAAGAISVGPGRPGPQTVSTPVHPVASEASGEGWHWATGPLHQPPTATVDRSTAGMKAIPENTRASMDIQGLDLQAQRAKAMSSMDDPKRAAGGATGAATAGVVLGVVAAGGDGSVRKGAKAGSGKAGIGTTAAQHVSGKGVFAEATQQVGSLMYMAPELLNSQPYNHKVDVFSFGVMMYELFCGKLLACRAELMVGGEEAVNTYVARRAAGERERLPARWPPALKELVADCWAQDARMRPSFKQILERLQAMEASGAVEGLIPSAQGAIQGDGGGGCCTIM